MSFMHEGSFQMISFVPWLKDLPIHVSMFILVTLLLLVFSWMVRKQVFLQIKKIHAGDEEAMNPEVRITLKNVFELLTESLYHLTESVMGKNDAVKYFPCIGVLFIVIATSNLIGLVPGFQPPTENLNTTLALGCFVFLYYHYVGLKTHGLKYVKHFLGPLIWISPLMFVIEVVSHLFRPVSLALRLRGNIFGDHIVLSVFSSLVPYLLPVVFYGLGVFVALMQAFVFCVMTMIYISLSAAHEH